LPEQFRAYCANAALSYERVKPVTVDGRSVEEIREEVRREIHEEQHRQGEEAREKLMDEIRRRREATPPSERVRRALTDALTDEEDQISEAGRALIDDIVARVTEGRPSHRYISEIASPPHPQVVVKKRVSPVVDADVAQYDCGMTAKCVEKPDVSDRGAEMKSVAQPPKTPPHDTAGFSDQRSAAVTSGQPALDRSDDARGPRNLWHATTGLPPATSARDGTKSLPPASSLLPWGAPRAKPVAIILYAPAFANFQTSSGRRFTASETGELIVVDERDIEDLLRAGCRRTA
jgi:hypothetical protein